MKKLSAKLFSIRSYTPIPFLILMLVYQEANIWSLILGFIIALKGELIRLWGVCWAGSETRTTGNVGGTYLIISGPFAHVRNPLYVGNILIYVGLGIMSLALFPYLQIAALLYFSFQYHFIVKEEEDYLIKTYGEQYKKYVENVPRFFWKPFPYKDKTVEQPPFNLKAGLRSEKRTLQAFVIVSLTLIIMWYVGRV